jgi:hypothetical protein
MSSASRIAQFKAALGKKVYADEEANAECHRPETPTEGQGQPRKRKPQAASPGKKQPLRKVRSKGNDSEELARTKALKRFEYKPKTSAQVLERKCRFTPFPPPPPTTQLTTAPAPPPPRKTVAGTEVFYEEKDNLVEERRRLIDSVLQKVMNKQLSKETGFRSAGKDEKRSHDSDTAHAPKTENHPDAASQQRVRTHPVLH